MGYHPEDEMRIHPLEKAFGKDIRVFGSKSGNEGLTLGN